MYCVDLELAIKLKENDFKDESCHFLSHNDGSALHSSESDFCTGELARPTSDELLEQLPSSLIFKNTNIYLNISKLKDKYSVEYHDSKYPEIEIVFWMEDEKLSNALAKMWLFLKSKDFLK